MLQRLLFMLINELFLERERVMWKMMTILGDSERVIKTQKELTQLTLMSAGLWCAWSLLGIFFSLMRVALVLASNPWPAQSSPRHPSQSHEESRSAPAEATAHCISDGALCLCSTSSLQGSSCS